MSRTTVYCWSLSETNRTILVPPSVLAAYVVDEAAVAAAIGSGDDALVSRIVTSNPDEFDDEDDFPVGGKRPSLRTALRHLIVDGESAISDDPQYRYAFEELCRFTGKLAFADRFDAHAIRPHELFDSPLPFHVPNPPDFPRLGYLAPDGAEAELSRIQALDQSALDESAVELVRAWVGCLKSAKRKRCGVVLTGG